MFLSANNFFWQVVRRGQYLTKTKLWRDLGRPEAALIGVQYRANGKAPRRPWIVRRSRAASWIFAGTGLRSRIAALQRRRRDRPDDTRVASQRPGAGGDSASLRAGMTAQMTYYEAASGAKVFAAGAFYLTRLIHVDPVVSRLIENLWARLASD